MIDSVTISLSPLTKWILGGALTFFTGFFGFMSKKAYHTMTNCVPTIQRNTEETNKLLRELVGYFKAKAEDGKL